MPNLQAAMSSIFLKLTLIKEQLPSSIGKKFANNAITIELGSNSLVIDQPRVE